MTGEQNINTYKVLRSIAIIAPNHEKEGYRFSGWKVEQGYTECRKANLIKTILFMQASDVILTANYTKI